jgi:hypothetical protein
METTTDCATAPATRILFLKCEEDSPAFDQTVFPVEVLDEDERFWHGHRVGKPRSLLGPTLYPKFAWKAMPSTRREIPPDRGYQEALDDPFVARPGARPHEGYRVMRVLARCPHGTILDMEPVAGHTGYSELGQARAAALALIGEEVSP